MQQPSKLWAVALIVFGLGLGVFAFKPTPAPATANQQPAMMGGPKYTVVETDGSMLLVVDNSTNRIYFYTVDPGQEIGSELKLRGSADLNDVGKPSIKPTTHIKPEAPKK